MGAGVLLVAANYASRVTTGKGMLPNVLKTRRVLQSKRKPEVKTAAEKTGKAGKASAVQAKHALLQVIRSVEAPKHQRLRHRATFYTLGVTVCRYSSPLMMALIFTTVIGGGLPALTALGVRGVFVQLGVLSSAMLTSVVAESFIRQKSYLTWRNYAGSIEHELRVSIYAHIQKQDMAELEKQGVGQLAGLINNDLDKIHHFLEYSSERIIYQAVNITVVGLLILLTMPILLLLGLLFIPLPRLLGRYYAQLRGRFLPMRQAENSFNNNLLNSLSGLAVIKSFNRELYEKQRLRASSKTVHEKYMDAHKMSSYLAEVGASVYQLILVSSMIISSLLYLLGRVSLTPFILQNFLLGKMTSMSGSLQTDYNAYRNALLSAEHLQAFFSRQPSIVSGHHLIPPGQNPPLILFDNVSFAYTNNKPVLKNIHLHIEPGKNIAFVGPTGSGKSTLVKLLLRFHDVSGGQILLNGHDVRALDLSGLRQVISVVSQDVYLFPGTIYANILYGNPESTYEGVIEAARMAEALEFIEKLPDGFNSLVSERGQNLSGGQRQRLSIARAILKNAPIMILDEATSAVDNETEAAIQRSISRFSQGRTTIIIAHRLSTIRHADRIYVIKEGRITGMGTHETLLACDPYYAKLWRLQAGEHHGL